MHELAYWLVALGAFHLHLALRLLLFLCVRHVTVRARLLHLLHDLALLLFVLTIEAIAAHHTVHAVE